MTNLELSNQELSVLCDLLLLSSTCRSECIWRSESCQDCKDCAFNEIRKKLQVKVVEKFEKVNN